MKSYNYIFKNVQVYFTRKESFFLSFYKFFTFRKTISNFLLSDGIFIADSSSDYTFFFVLQ